MAATDRYVHPSEERTIDEHHPPIRSIPSELPPLPMLPMDTTPAVSDRTTIITPNQFVTDALAFLTSAMNTYPVYEFVSSFYSYIHFSMDSIPS